MYVSDRLLNLFFAFIFEFRSQNFGGILDHFFLRSKYKIDWLNYILFPNNNHCVEKEIFICFNFKQQFFLNV